MADNSKRTGAAIEAHYQFLLWLGPALENFPKDKKFTLGDRIMDHALDVLEALIDDNVASFRNRLRGLRNRWRAGTIGVGDVEPRVRTWIALVENTQT